MGDELNNSIYDGEPADNPEQEESERREQRERQAQLPKFVLPEGAELHITREQIAELNGEYFVMLDDMRKGFAVTNETLRSYMESVVFESYKNDVKKMQRAGEIEGEHKAEVYTIKKQMLTPGYERCGFFRRRLRPNYQMRLCMQEAKLEAELESAVYRDEIARQQAFLNDDPEEETEVSEFINLILDEFIPARRYNRFVKENWPRLVWLFSEYAQEHRVIEVFKELIELLVPKPKKRRRFTKKNGEYLMGLLEEFLQKPAPVPPPESEEESDEEEGETDEQEELQAPEEKQEQGGESKDEGAKNANDSAENENKTEEPADELEDLSVLQKLEDENVEAPADESKTEQPAAELGEQDNAEQLKIEVPAEPQKLALMIIPPPIMSWVPMANKVSEEKQCTQVENPEEQKKH